VVEQFNRALTLAGTRIVESVANFLPGVLVFFVLHSMLKFTLFENPVLQNQSLPFM